MLSPQVLEPEEEWQRFEEGVSLATAKTVGVQGPRAAEQARVVLGHTHACSGQVCSSLGSTFLRNPSRAGGFLAGKSRP